MAGTPTRSSPAAPKNRKPQRVVPVIPHALDSKNRSAHTQSPSEHSNQAVDTKPVLPNAADGQLTTTKEVVVTTEAQIPTAPVDSSDGEAILAEDTSHATPVIKSAMPVVEAKKTTATDISEGPKDTPTLVSVSKVESVPIQPIRELPPPFYPNQSVSSSATSTSLPHEAPQARPPVHHARPNANGLVFGSFRESADSSPAPAPPAPGPYHHMPYSGYSYPSQGPPTFFPSGHSYHMSEPHPVPMYQPPFVHNTNNFGQTRDFHNHGTPHMAGARPFYPPHNRFQHSQRRPDEYNFQPRQPHLQSRMHPPAPPFQPSRQPPAPGIDPARTIHPDIVPASSTSTDGSQHHRQNESNVAYQRTSNLGHNVSQTPENATSRQFPPPVNTSSFDDASNLSQYIHRQFGNREFADYVLQFSHTAYLLPTFNLPAHGIILARSPKLRSLMAMQVGGPSEHQPNPRLLSVPIADKFLNSDVALMQALMRLYGESLPDQSFLARVPPPVAPLPVEHMRFALAYAAAGHFLEIDEIISRGLDLAGSFLGWENVGFALAFALEGGLSSHFVATEGGAEDRGSNSSLDDNSTKPESPASAPAYGFYSDRLLNCIIAFLVHQWPVEFDFIPTAPQLPNVPRLPAVAEPKHGRANSRLSQIRFGEMSLEDDQTPSAATTALSSVLLSLPYLVLKHVFENKTLGERVGWTKVARIMRVVIDERERRRQRAMASKDNSGPESSFEERLWHTARFVESVERAEDSATGFKLARALATANTPTLVSVNTPTSSESAKS